MDSSSCLLLQGVPLDIHEDLVADSLKPYGPLAEVRRRFDDHGRQLNEVIVFFDSTADATDVYRGIQRSSKPLTIGATKPTVSYWHDEEKPKGPKRRIPSPEDSPTHISGRMSPEMPSNGLNDDTEPDWMTRMTIYGLPGDFKASFEIEGLIQHILGLPPMVRPIARIELEVTDDEAHAIANLVFTEHIHLAVLMGRTLGQVVFRGFPLTLVPASPPLIVSSARPRADDATTSDDTFTPLLPQQPPPYGFLPPLSTEPNAFTWNHPTTRAGDTHQLNDENNMPSSASMDVDTPHRLQNDTSGPEEEKTALTKETLPVRTGPVEFSLKASAPSAAPKTSLNISSSSKLLPTSQLSTSSAIRPAPAKSVARGGRHFVNIPSDRPARATLPVHCSADLPFTRGTICLLCRLQFASIEDVKRHVKESSHHESQLSSLLLKHNISRSDFDLQAAISSESKLPNAKKRQREQESEEIDLDDDLPSMAPSGAKDLQADPSEGTHSASSANVGMKMLQRMGYTGGAFGRQTHPPQQ